MTLHNAYPPRRHRLGVAPNDLAEPLFALRTLVNPLAQALGPNSEVVLHDFKRLPNSIVAIGGNLTRRVVGGPITDLLLERLRAGKTEDLLRYRSTGPTGSALMSSTIFVRESDGTPVGCLCINMDVTPIAEAQHLLTGLLPDGAPFGRLGALPPSAAAQADESFPQTVEQLTTSAVMGTISSMGVPVSLMQKRHKLEVVRELDRRGIFLIRDSVEFVASSLGVTRYTIYNYLNSIDANYEARPVKRLRARVRRVPATASVRVSPTGTST